MVADDSSGSSTEQLAFFGVSSVEVFGVRSSADHGMQPTSPIRVSEPTDLVDSDIDLSP